MQSQQNHLIPFPSVPLQCLLQPKLLQLLTHPSLAKTTETNKAVFSKRETSTKIMKKKKKKKKKQIKKLSDEEEEEEKEKEKEKIPIMTLRMIQK